MRRHCEMCPDKSTTIATVFCPADECYLCTACDDVVHTANRLASRHVRRPVSIDENEMDGSSINDESEVALVPDVGETQLQVVEDRKPSALACTSQLLELHTEVPSFEDAAGYDFSDFDALGAKMPALCGIDDDGLWGDGKLAKSFYSDISWESVVNESVEHVVPDVERAEKGKTSKTQVKTEVRVSSVTTVAAKVTKGEKVEKVEKMDVDTGDKSKKEPVEVDMEKPKEEMTEEEKTAKQKEEEAKALEHRKKRRQEALARFRSKRANRSFVKKVRYECRKQLADSRPRVKGRFVRKVEMALFRKYGALYRDHLDELKEASRVSV